MGRKISTPELLEPLGVFDYLKNTSFRPISVSRIQAGTTNYAYRIFYQQPANQGKDQTAILKYFAPYMAGEPSVPFSPERSAFEARALIHIPWQTFQYSSVLAKHPAKTCSGVDMPKLYFHDSRSHVLVIEDCAPEHGKHQISGQSTNMICQLLNNVAQSKKKDAAASFIGGMLGAFLAQLQSWGCESHNHEKALELFGRNDAARDVIIQETYTDFFKNLKQIGYEINNAQRAKLETRLQDLECLTREDWQSVSMGDFWSVPAS